MYFDEAGAASSPSSRSSTPWSAELIHGCGFIPWLPRAGTAGMLDCYYVRLESIKGFKCCSAWRVSCERGENDSHPFPPATKSVSTPAEKKTLGKYSKCGKGGISDADIPVCSRLFAKSRQTWMLFFQLSGKSFVLLGACCSSPCRRLLLWERCYPSLFAWTAGTASLSLLYLLLQ